LSETAKIERKKTRMSNNIRSEVNFSEMNHIILFLCNLHILIKFKQFSNIEDFLNAESETCVTQRLTYNAKSIM